MKLSIKALVLAGGIIWALGLLIVGLINMAQGYGASFLQIMASIYPLYTASGTYGDLIIGVVVAFIDGALCLLVFGLLYNAFVGKKAVPKRAAPRRKAAPKRKSASRKRARR